MKKIYNGILICLILLGFAACEPNEDSKKNLGSIIPKEDIKVSVKIDEENSNLLHFKLETPSCIGRFICQEAGINKQGTEFSQLIAWADDYILNVQVYNSAGLSDTLKIPFVVETDIYGTYLSGGDSNPSGKVWRINGSVAGHIGCGPEGGTSNEWWNPAPNSLSPELYNDDMTFFAAANRFALDNKGGSLMNESTGALFPDGNTTATFVTTHYTPSASATWSVYRDSDTGESWLQMNNAFPAYAVNPNAINGDKYKIISLTDTDMHIVYLPGGISWHYFLTSNAR